MDVTGNTSDTDNMLYGVLGTRSSGTSATGQVTLSNSNLLRNWYFAGSGGGVGEFPVNQRGQTSYTGSGFTVDGWYARNSMTVGVQSDGIHLSFPSGSTTLKGLNQTFTAFQNYLVGKTVTVSVLVKDFVSFGSTSYPKFGLYSGNSIGVHSSAKLTGVIDGNGLFTATGTLGSNLLDYSNLNFTVCYANQYSGSLTVVAAKMELGTQQTLAHLEAGEWVVNEIPNYWDELSKCQRYLKQVINWSDLYAARSDTSTLMFFIPGTMARVPDTLTSKQVYFYAGSNYYTITDDITFTSQYGGIRGNMPKGSIPNNSGGTVTFASAFYISAE